jgi:hypothetical protein
MLENYMDYSDENCLNTFTQQQVAAMRYVIETYRFNLLLSQGAVSTHSPKIDIYPNPAREFLNIKVFNSEVELKSAMITDLSGRIVGVYSNPLEQTINLSGLNSGIYFINIHTSQGVIVHKFMHL